ncbi:glycoside hydrolase family 2 TIM barrel-domain containing protein [Mangrovimonas sp. YM274]|uniref:glycoside hydrolase family 2 TIM barrel-domain containing protein n=1 Tax=Mangrovimonas sp. YM274 TaxID=3070660 RepID=UPI0027DCDFD6|nr:glycoside hydrolase family 2 TIM barrel-domain containing protein [Mangrovimonas sp. YM274]WMI67642.1 glycoside hydrolase family 2 TIM barrel-domain containing protein [Mangrovimonas sp. YM274]
MKRLSISILLVIMLLSTFLYINRPSRHVMAEEATVRIIETEKGYEIIRNGEPFYIKGAGGKPFFKELSEAGANTLRLYDTTNTAEILDEAQKYNIAVILDIWLPQYGKGNNLYKDAQFVKTMKAGVKKFVDQHKGHPALLMWNLGNELVYPVTLRDNEFIDTFNDMIDQIHEDDPNHPVSTTVAGGSRGQTLSIHLNSPQLDLVGYNIFGGLKNIKRNQKQLSLVINVMPYYITEWAGHGPWEHRNTQWSRLLEPTSAEKSEIYKRKYETYIESDEESLGSIAFYWGQKNEGTPTWFNIIDEEGRKSNVYYALKEVWSGEQFEEDAPEVSQILLNQKLDSDLQVYSTKDTLEAVLKLERPDSNYIFKWEVLKEGLGFGASSKRKLNMLNGDTIAIHRKERIQFQAPKEEGAYRLMAYVYDDNQNFATANIPFFIVKE